MLPNREPALLTSASRRLKNDELFLGGFLNKGTETSLKLRVMSAVPGTVLKDDTIYEANYILSPKSSKHRKSKSNLPIRDVLLSRNS
jgi:hypothetical protein